jgi:AraC-like DNA-binding protein
MQPDLHCSYRPAPPLDRFVERLWYWEGTPPSHAKDRLMPTGGASLVINLAEDEIRSYSGPDDSIVSRHPGAVIVGACSRYTVIDTREQRAVLGVTFLPGGMTPFFDPAADELTNTHSGLCDVWGTHGSTLRERVLAAATSYSRLKVVEAELLRRALRPLQRRAEIDFVIAQLTHRPDRSIASLSQQTGLSSRRVTRLFAIETGLTPKLYARVKRFERALRFFGAESDWSDLAVRCGYFDQSHLIRDCREISGYTPEQLQARRTGGTNHVAVG